jgi:hypothetical protein
VLVDNFSDQKAKEGTSVFLTEEQKKWIAMQQLAGPYSPAGRMSVDPGMPQDGLPKFFAPLLDALGLGRPVVTLRQFCYKLCQPPAQPDGINMMERGR